MYLLLKAVYVPLEIAGNLGILPALGGLPYCGHNDRQQSQNLITKLGGIVPILLYFLCRWKLSTCGREPEVGHDIGRRDNTLYEIDDGRRRRWKVVGHILEEIEANPHALKDELSRRCGRHQGGGEGAGEPGLEDGWGGDGGKN